MPRNLIRIKELKARIGLSVPTIYRLIAAKKFPPAVSLGPGSVGWIEDEVDAWIEARIAERDNPRQAA